MGQVPDARSFTPATPRSRTGATHNSRFWQDLQKALALDSRNADAWTALSAIEDDPDRAEAYVRRAVAIEPNSARAQFGLSQAVLSHVYRSAPARVDEVIAHVQQAMRLDPLEPRYPTALAEIYNFQRTTEIDKAEPLLSRALELDPNYFPALYALGALHFCWSETRMRRR